MGLMPVKKCCTINCAFDAQQKRVTNYNFRIANGISRATPRRIGWIEQNKKNWNRSARKTWLLAKAMCSSCVCLTICSELLDNCPVGGTCKGNGTAVTRAFNDALLPSLAFDTHSLFIWAFYDFCAVISSFVWIIWIACVGGQIIGLQGERARTRWEKNRWNLWILPSPSVIWNCL